MRKELRKEQGIRKTFIGIFRRYGTKTNWHGFPEKTILLVDVRDSKGKIVTDHIWFSMTKGFEKIGELQEGNQIQFDARIKKYVKGYAGYRQDVQIEKPLEEDYKLNNPSKIMLIEAKDVQ